MRYVPLVLLLACVTPVDQPLPPSCKGGLEYEWREVSGHCGTFADVVTRMQKDECPATLASVCLWRADVTSMAASRGRGTRRRTAASNR
jgi:hypothetical protein